MNEATIRRRNALQDTHFPSDAARDAWHQSVKDGHSGFFAQCASVAVDLDRIGPVWLAERLAAMTDHEVTLMILDAYMSGNTAPARKALLSHLSRRPSGE